MLNRDTTETTEWLSLLESISTCNVGFSMYNKCDAFVAICCVEYSGQQALASPCREHCLHDGISFVIQGFH